VSIKSDKKSPFKQIEVVNVTESPSFSRLSGRKSVCAAFADSLLCERARCKLYCSSELQSNPPNVNIECFGGKMFSHSPLHNFSVCFLVFVLVRQSDTNRERSKTDSDIYSFFWLFKNECAHSSEILLP